MTRIVFLVELHNLNNMINIKKYHCHQCKINLHYVRL